MKTLVACLILALLLSGCRGKDRPVAEPDEPQSRADTLAAVDAAVNDADEPSDAVDRLFDLVSNKAALAGPNFSVKAYQFPALQSCGRR